MLASVEVVISLLSVPLRKPRELVLACWSAHQAVDCGGGITCWRLLFLCAVYCSAQFHHRP